MRRALLIYAGLSVVLLGVGVAAHPATSTIGSDDLDFSSFVWFVSWWPHALLAGREPLHTTFLFAPGGYNLAWAATVPALALVAAPITLLGGPVVAYNALAVAAPVLAATGAFLLCRQVTGAVGPALVGGAVFGFSPYMMGNEQASALNLMHVGLVPVGAWLVLLRLDGRITRPRFTAWLALTLVIQFLISPEVLATASLFGALLLVAGFAVFPQRRQPLRGLARPLAIAYGLLAVAVSPFLYAMFARPHLAPALTATAPFSSDLLSLVVPSAPVGIGAGQLSSLSARFPGGPLPAQHGFAYLGLPLLALLVVAVLPGAGRRSFDRRLRFVAAATLASALASLGPRLHVAGHTLLPLPWAVLAHLPLLSYAIPSRMAMFTALGAGLVLAGWLSARPSRSRWALAAITLLLLVPAPSRFGRGLDEPTAYRDGRIAGLLRAEDVVFAMPPFGASMRWQAETGIAYRLAGGYAGTSFPADYLRLYCQLAAPHPDLRTLVRFLRAHGVTALLAPSGEEGYLARLDPQAPRTRIGGQSIVRLAPPPATAPGGPLVTAGGALGHCPASG